jgi:hypothetical protein
LPQVIKSFHKNRGVATTFYSTLVVESVRQTANVESTDLRKEGKVDTLVGYSE